MANYIVFIISVLVAGVSCQDVVVSVPSAPLAPTLAPVSLPSVPLAPTLAPAATLAPAHVEPVVPAIAAPEAHIVPVAVATAAPVGKSVSDAADTTTGGVGINGNGYASDHSRIYQVGPHIVIMCIFAIFYKCRVVDKYPALDKFTDESAALQSENEVSALFNSCFSANCMLAWCCWAPRAAHTFDKVEILPYWPGLALMVCCPCLTITYTNACTDMNEKLGGEKRNLFMSLICAWCCTCCVILQDAASLDAATGVETHCCSVEGKDMESGGDSD